MWKPWEFGVGTGAARAWLSLNNSSPPFAQGKFFYFSAWSKYNWQTNCIYLKCTIWCFDICVHFEIITTNKLINESITSIVNFCVRVRTFKIYSLGKFQLYTTVLLTLVTTLYITSPELTHPITEKLSFIHIPDFQPPEINILPFFCEFNTFLDSTRVRSYKICLSLYGLLHLP